MPRILLIADLYVPNFAPRMGYLVKNLRSAGWEFDILTGPDDGDIRYRSLVGNEKVIRCSLSKIKSPEGFLENLYFTCMKIPLFFKQTKQYVHAAHKYLNPSDYQIILCSAAFSLPVIQASRILAKKWDKPWIADIRDIHEQMPIHKKGGKKIKVTRFLNRITFKYLINLRNKNLIQANIITTVSPFNKDLLQKLNPSTFLIYNGFDPESFFPTPGIKQNVFKLIYTGIFINYCSDIDIFFQSVDKLQLQRKISPDTFSVCFYTPEWCKNSIKSNVHFDKISAFISFKDPVDTSEIPKILHEASILLLFIKSVHANKSQGIIPTKYFEYLAVERPILLVPGDNAYLEESLLASGAGITAKNVETTSQFIYEKYQEWEKNGFTIQDVNKDYIQGFSRKKQALQFQGLFEDMLKKYS